MFALPAGRPAIMGILNVTPDSFSDGGHFFDPQQAVEHGIRLHAEGADLVDVGGESTRPGAEEVSVEEELRRVMPVVDGLVRAGVSVSIDSSKAPVAMAALQAGACVVNDVTALSDPYLAAFAARENATLCLMHMQGTPRTMQADPRYEDVVAEVRAHLLDRAALAQSQGLPREHLWIDPGIGFGKTLDHNIALLCELSTLVDTGYPVVIGVSRKSFLGKLLGTETSPLPVDQREEATLAAQVLAQHAGAKVIRTHNVLAAVRAARIASALA